MANLFEVEKERKILIRGSKNHWNSFPFHIKKRRKVLHKNIPTTSERDSLTFSKQMSPGSKKLWIGFPINFYIWPGMED